MKEFFFALWFFAPAGLANVMAFASGKISLLKRYHYPADFYLRFKGKRLLGNHKTLRGFFIGTISSIIGVYLQLILIHLIPEITFGLMINYDNVNPIYLGFLLGFGALLGDSVKSFFKRRRGLVPGQSWIFFDQVDYIVGGILLSSIYIKLPLVEYFLIIIVWLIIHPVVSYIGYLLKLKRRAI